MKRNKIILLIVLVIVVIVGIIIGISSSILKNNDTGENLVLSCNSEEIIIDGEVTCTLKGNVTDYEVSAVSSVIDIDSSDLELEEVEVDSIWEGDGEDGDVDLYTDENKSGEFNILTFTVSLEKTEEEEVVIKLIENSYFDQEYQEHKIEDISKILKVRK